MNDFENKFYLGKKYASEKGSMTDELLLYDPEDLTTHAVAVGMTGSGKTGLCIDLLEEAALHDIPALMIDPKGDMTNTLLHFPELRGQDFQPWVNPDQARREGITPQQFAQEMASLWKNGLADWDIGSDRIQALNDKAQFAVYTPGSEAGVPINILSSFEAPDLPWEENRESLRERISGTVSGLLGLVGITEIDPVQSKEHILLSNIFEHAWSRNHSLDMGELILQIQNPPFEKLGMIGVDQFLPEKERLELSMQLNNILAAPTFQSWIIGTPLDIDKLLYTPQGKPRHSVLYIAHLSEAERMFFVTLLYAAVETWMRRLKGTTSLRAIIYFDEIFGYLPPVKNPPSKTPMLRMLKQARAFGVGQVLVTQNPVDVDYKALSNAGTWFIGKLQTEQDKDRLLEGLEGATPGIERQTYDRLISTLDKRVFLLHNVHEEKPALFYTRWAMNYLTGPLTRTQIPALNELANVKPAPTATGSRKESSVAGLAGQEVGEQAAGAALPGSATRPKVPDDVEEYFFPLSVSWQSAAKNQGLNVEEVEEMGVIYRPALVAQANVRFLQRKYNLDLEKRTTAVLFEPDRQGRIDWENWIQDPLDLRSLERNGEPSARYDSLNAPLSDGSLLGDLKTDFKDWIYHNLSVTVKSNQALDVFAGPQITQENFQEMLQETAEAEKQEEIEEINEDYKKKIKRIQERLLKEERELAEDETELSQRKMEEMGTHMENVLSLLSGRRKRLSTSLSKRRMTSKAKADVKESLEEIESYQREIEDLKEELEQELQDIEDEWQEKLQEIEEIEVTPYKKDILVELFGVVWYPYHALHSQGQWQHEPAFS